MKEKSMLTMKSKKFTSDAIKVGKEKGKCIEDSFGQYIDHNRRYMKLFRMWELGSTAPTWKVTFVTLSTSVLMTTNFLLGIGELLKFQSAPDLPTIASLVGAFWLHLVGFFKWFYFVWKVHDVMDLVGQLEECYNLSLGMSDSDEGSLRVRFEMNEARKSSIRFTRVWSLFVIWGVTHWCMNPVFLKISLSRTNDTFAANERLLPYVAWIPWDTKSLSGYGYTYLFEFLGSVSSCVGHIFYDVFYMTIVMMICAQLRYLNYFLVEHQEKPQSREMITFSFIQNKFKLAKNHHNAVLKFLSSLQKITSPVMFVQCIGTMGILCLVSFEASTMNVKGDTKNMIRVWSMVEYIIGCFIQIFCFCYYASKVTTLGLRIGESAYDCGWESLVAVNEKQNSVGEATEKGRSAVKFQMIEMIARSQKPVRLTGGPFYVLSLETYRALVSAAFSYATVLRGMSDD